MHDLRNGSSLSEDPDRLMATMRRGSAAILPSDTNGRRFAPPAIELAASGCSAPQR